MTDLCLNKEYAQLTSNIDNVLQQLEMVLDTREGEILGDSLGSDFDQFLFDTNAGNGFVSRYIENSLKNNINLLGWNLKVNVDFMLGIENDIMIIHIILDNGEYELKKDYKITQGSISPVL